MGTEKDDADAGRRTWHYVLGSAWLFFGLVTMVDGRTLLGACQLLLGVVSLAAARSSRVAAFADGPLFRRRRDRDRDRDRVSAPGRG
ncbi:hypothetical protein [Nocardioides zeicaulis]|uniref:Uncharacterized protein n=1 Tax=Nocardioides zeicaulis TaxID=1776857 RepID=A0ABV6DWG2_9ACTN